MHVKGVTDIWDIEQAADAVGVRLYNFRGVGYAHMGGNATAYAEACTCREEG